MLRLTAACLYQCLLILSRIEKRFFSLILVLMVLVYSSLLASTFYIFLARMQRMKTENLFRRKKKTILMTDRFGAL